MQKKKINKEQAMHKQYKENIETVIQKRNKRIEQEKDMNKNEKNPEIAQKQCRDKDGIKQRQSKDKE